MGIGRRLEQSSVTQRVPGSQGSVVLRHQKAIAILLAESTFMTNAPNVEITTAQKLMLELQDLCSLQPAARSNDERSLCRAQ